jgi:hypothetical protein
VMQGWSIRRAVITASVITGVGVVALFVPGPGNRNAVFGITTVAIGLLTAAMAAVSAVRKRRGPHP